MSILEPRRWDLVNAKESIKLVHAFLYGPELVMAYKERQKKKVIEIWDPFSELIFALDAIPVFPARFQQFSYKNVNSVLAGITRITRTFGWDALNNLMHLAFFTRLGAEVVETLFNNLIDAFGDGISREPVGRAGKAPIATRDVNGPYACTKASSRIRSLTKNIADFRLELNCECNNGQTQARNERVFPSTYQGIEIPDGEGRAAESIMEEQIQSFVNGVENVTCTRFSEDKLAELIRVSNEIKMMYKELLFDICTGDIIPYNPLTFGTILFFMMASLYDMNSNITAYRKNVQNIINEFHKRVQEGYGFKINNVRKILAFPSFPGLDITSVKVISALQALPVLADWEILGFFEPIDASNNVLKNYARHVLVSGQNLTGKGMRVTPNVMRVANDLHVDGISIQRNLGCKMPGKSVALIEQEARKNRLPTTTIDTSYPGDDMVHYISKISSLLYTIGG